MNIIKVQKNDEDAKLIMNWRNDPLSRQNSLNSDEKIWTQFKNEFYYNYFKNIPLFATLNNIKIAFVSFLYTNKKNTLKIGINIAPEYRGKKLGSKIIQLSINYIKDCYHDIKYIIADIKKFNIPSIRAFTSAGFKYEYEDNTLEIQKYIYSI